MYRKFAINAVRRSAISASVKPAAGLSLPNPKRHYVQMRFIQVKSAMNQHDVKELFDPVVEPMLKVIPGELLERVYPPSNVDEEDLLYNTTTLGDVMMKKEAHQGIEFVHERDSVYSAIEKMSQQRIGAVLVKNAAGQVCGIFSERDYLSKIVLKGKYSKTTEVMEVMTSPVISLPVYAKVAPTMKMMTSKRFRHVPLVDDKDNVVGLISIGDLVKEISDEYRGTIHTLKDFINKPR